MVRILALCFILVATRGVCADREDPGLPEVPDGFQVAVYASEPLVRNPCAMAFDTRGRLFVGQGPQYRKPKPDSATDRVTLLIDTDGDGVAEQAHTFAEGFNSIQGMAWRGDQLWIANAPDLTVVRDLDGDDVADEYRRIYGGLGNLEHALHGLVFAPDGWLYMSKGNSRGYVRADSPERFVAPEPFADLWGVDLPKQLSTVAEQEIFSRESYRHGYHTPSDDWGTEGGVLRCRPDGSRLEIFSRGMRNMWDVNFDAEFNWVGTDQDQDGGDRILNPFLGAHFGWGHAWSPHWTGQDHPPTVPISGPVFHGSGTGVVYGAPMQFPERYRHAFYCADWLSRTIFLYRPKWEGGMMRNMETPEVFAKAPAGRTMGSSQGMLFDPTDIEFGPDGALWVLSWGHGYGAEIEDGKHVDMGRVYRIGGKPLRTESPRPKYLRSYPQWTTAELMEDLHHQALPVRRTDAQVELVRRGSKVREEIVAALGQSNQLAGATTWLLWTLGQLDFADASVDQFLIDRVADKALPIGARIQAIRVMGFRASHSGQPLPQMLQDFLRDDDPRLRFEAAQAMQQSGDTRTSEALWKMVHQESDRAAFYAARMALAKIVDTAALRRKLEDGTSQQRLAALLNLLEKAELTGDEVLPLRLDTNPTSASLASSFVSKVGTSQSPILSIERQAKRADQADKAEEGLRVEILTGDVPEGLHVLYTIDGSEPTDTTGIRYRGAFEIREADVVAASLFRGRQRMGPVLRRTYRSISEAASSQTVARSSPPPIAVRVSDIRLVGSRPVTQDRTYKSMTLVEGGSAYGNRRFVWKSLPAEFVGQTVIQSRNDDADVGSVGDDFLRFRIDEEAEVYVAHDERIKEKPKWLDRFQATPLTATTQDTTYRLFVKRFPPGFVQLGGNTSDGVTRARSQYVTIVKPASLQPRHVATTVGASLEKLETADYRRGARLFFEQADCSKCHRMGAFGNALAPNLTNMGSRAAPRTIAESILMPNAVIMEGFHSVSVLTDEGKLLNGFIKQESGLSLELVQADATVLKVPKDSIVERKRRQISAMPEGYANQLAPQQVADLIRFILDAGESPSGIISFTKGVHAGSQVTGSQVTGSQVTGSQVTGSQVTGSQVTGSQVTGSQVIGSQVIGSQVIGSQDRGNSNEATLAANQPAAATLDLTTPITFTDNGKALRIVCGESEVATYVYRHDQVKRPFFAHAKAPSGTQVTRNFPPVEADRKDHAEMHPGIWMAFGDLNGEDFWRNQAVVVHERFTQDPKSGPGWGSFSQRKAYRRKDGRLVCLEDFHCVIRVHREGYLLEWDSTFFAPDDVGFYFGDQEEMGLGIRVATGITELESGEIIDAEGRRGAKQVWSQSSKWCDYSGRIANDQVGISILCHPNNFRDSWMHARNYGLVAANPFGQKAMKKGPSSRISIEGGGKLRLRYGILLHGPRPNLDDVYRQYVARTIAESKGDH